MLRDYDLCGFKKEKKKDVRFSSIILSLYMLNDSNHEFTLGMGQC